jgi:pyridoxal phosphate enzyme (YggS family)
MSDVVRRLAEVRARIARACDACGRDPASVALIAVSKTHPADAIRAAYDAGQRAFGESYAQELAAKSEALAELAELEWHFIGHLQSNKAKLVAKSAHVVHALASASTAQELAKRAALAGRPVLSALLEVNVSGEAQKHGVAPSELSDLIRAVRAEPGLALRGLMTMPPLGEPEVARATFATLASLRNLHGGPELLPELSMGMSGDFEIAIACGSTMVRVGTAIFGER